MTVYKHVTVLKEHEFYKRFSKSVVLLIPFRIPESQKPVLFNFSGQDTLELRCFPGAGSSSETSVRSQEHRQAGAPERLVPKVQSWNKNIYFLLDQQLRSKN